MKNMERAKLTAPKEVSKFNHLANARSFANRPKKPMVILLGDDQLFWVVSLALGEELAKAGYELAE